MGLAEDPALMITRPSMHRTGSVPFDLERKTSNRAFLAQHPLKQFLEHGVLASLNTDDPAVQGERHSRLPWRRRRQG